MQYLSALVIKIKLGFRVICFLWYFSRVPQLLSLVTQASLCIFYRSYTVFYKTRRHGILTATVLCLYYVFWLSIVWRLGLTLSTWVVHLRYTHLPWTWCGWRGFCRLSGFVERLFPDGVRQKCAWIAYAKSPDESDQLREERRRP